MRIDQNSAGLQSLRQHARQTDEARTSTKDAGQGLASSSARPENTQVSETTLQRVAAANSAAAASRLTDATLAEHLASLTAEQIVQNGPLALAAQANIDPATVHTLLQS